MPSAAVSADIYKLREREYLKSHKEEEGTNFIKLVSTHCFNPGYFNITYGAFIRLHSIVRIHTSFLASQT